MREFDYRMNMGASTAVAHKVNKTQFGDGYAQLSRFGINNKILRWNGNKTGDLETVIKPIQQFIDDHRGTKPFLWTDPHGDTKQYTCAGYSTNQRKGNIWQISLEFEQFINV